MTLTVVFRGSGAAGGGGGGAGSTGAAGGVSNIEDVFGGQGNDIIVGNAQDNAFWGGVDGRDILIGRGHELAGHHMEIRGIGLIDVQALFGIRAVRQQKRIEVVVQLEDWETAKDVAERTGLAHQTVDILGVPIPKVVVPLNPGKNITVVSEVVAMMHLLRYSGIDVAAAFNERLIKKMKEKRGLRTYLQEDYE